VLLDAIGRFIQLKSGENGKTAIDVLDRQLKSTVSQFEQIPGMVMKIDDTSTGRLP
jgi:hypothetical protein